ncbi:MAG: hypothetical protein QOH79_561 [Acidimicrobiaceae bacterium]
MCETLRTRRVDHDGGSEVPLSEDEQRILHQIEQQFYETDPALARAVGSTSLYRHAFRQIKYASFTFLLGVAILVYSLVAFGFLAAFLGFLVMFASVLWLEHNARKLGRAGLQQMTSSMRAAGLRDAFGNTRDRMREKFKRDEN